MNGFCAYRASESHRWLGALVKQFAFLSLQLVTQLRVWGEGEEVIVIQLQLHKKV